MSSRANDRPSERERRTNRWPLFAGLIVIAVLCLFRHPLQNRVLRRLALSNDAPAPEVIQEIIENSPDRVAAFAEAWNSGNIVRRQAAIREAQYIALPNQPLPAPVESILLCAALDVDMSVRETAIAILRSLKHPAVLALAAAQFNDSDPQIRLLGLQSLKQADAARGIPIIIPLLNEKDPLVLSFALKQFEQWSGEKFGIKLSETVSLNEEERASPEFRESSREKIKAGLARAKAWWTAHQAAFNLAKPGLPQEALAPRPPIHAADFSLPALDGRRVHLSDFHGKVVLLNFWTTWCSACVTEIPELIALQKEQGDKVAILGIALDFVPDAHGHVISGAREGIRGLVERTAKARTMNYPVLLDENNDVGGRFNGGELPTTVIIDAKGNVRRRFVGARTLPVFEAMIAEAEH